MATARPCVAVHKTDSPKENAGSITLPTVFSAPLRADVVRTVHTGMNKNRRQAMGVKDQAGYDTAAASWGTGRAVARIPRVPGGGTHRSGQAAFGNMCRGGGMFNPTKTWRRWHRKINVTQKRHALTAAIAATAVPALVMARGHKVENIPELPLVVSDEAHKIVKTKDAIKLLTGLGVADDLKKVLDSKKIRCGRGKMRNRRYTMRKGPLIVHSNEQTQGANLTTAFRNIPGVDICHVDRLNLLQMAPGGCIGRLVVYTEGAMKRLQSIYGTYKGGSEKKGYTLPRSIMTNTDIARIINSNEIQSALAPAKAPKAVIRCRKNPLTNLSVLGRLCPWAVTQKRLARQAHIKGSKVQKSLETLKAKRVKVKAAVKGQSKQFYKELEGAYSAAVAPAEAADE